MADDVDLTAFEEDELRRISIHPDLWAETFMTLDGKPFSLAERPYLRPIYRQFMPTNKDRTVVLKCGRKVEKTTTIKNLIIYMNTMIPYFKTLYTTYRQDQVSAFVYEKFGDALLTCRYPDFQKMIVKNDASHKIFRIDEKITTHFFAKSAWAEAVGLLGLDCDAVFADEIQDFEAGWFEKINEILSQSEYKFLVISGTARETGTEFHKFWRASTQNEWDRDLEIWVPKNPGGLIEGYHISQEICPSISAEDLKVKKEMYTPRKYFNEVLGEFYSGASKPLTEEVVGWNLVRELNADFVDCAPVVEIIDPETQRPKQMIVETIAGCDFGNFDHVTVMTPERDVLTSFAFDARKYDEFSVLSKTIEDFNVKMFIGDYGHGARQIRELQASYDDTVRSCMYQKRPANPIDYKKKDKNRNPIYMYIVDRTTYMDKVVDAFYKSMYKIPYGKYRNDQPTGARAYVDKTLIPQLISIRSDIEEEDEGEITLKAGTWSSDYAKYGHEGEDHSFHTFVYCEIGISTKRNPPAVFDLGL